MFTVIEPRFTLTATLPATDKSSVAIVPVVPVIVRSSVATLPATDKSSVAMLTLPDTPRLSVETEPLVWNEPETKLPPDADLDVGP